MSAEQTLENLVELLGKFKYEKDEDSCSTSFFEAKLNEDWFFHLIEEAKRGVVEIAKLRENLAESVKAQNELHEQIYQLQQRAEAAEAKFLAAEYELREQKNYYDGEIAHYLGKLLVLAPSFGSKQANMHIT